MAAKQIRNMEVLLGISAMLLVFTGAQVRSEIVVEERQPSPAASSWGDQRRIEEQDNRRQQDREELAAALDSYREARAATEEIFGKAPPREVRKAVRKAEEIAAVATAQTAPRLLRAVEEIRAASLDSQLEEIFAEGTGSVDLIDLNTGVRVYELNAAAPMAAASTYKLFVLYDILNLVESGELDDDEYVDGVPLDACLHDMIVYSENECPEAWLDERGYEKVTELAESLGSTATSFEPGQLVTSARDLTSLLRQLHEGKLLNRKHTKLALQLMSEQIFQEGIPAGLDKDVEVASKVGWLDDVYNDAAILMGPKGVYALVIMTEDMPVEATAEATRAVYDWL